jgi:hypothetical protein
MILLRSRFGTRWRGRANGRSARAIASSRSTRGSTPGQHMVGVLAESLGQDPQRHRGGVLGPGEGREGVRPVSCGQEAFLEGHVHALSVLGGVPGGQIRYDDLSPAAKRVVFHSRSETGLVLTPGSTATR